MNEKVTPDMLGTYKKMLNDEMKRMQSLSGVPSARLRGIPSHYKKEDFIEHFKEHPELLAEILTDLRKDKIEKILNK